MSDTTPPQPSPPLEASRKPEEAVQLEPDRDLMVRESTSYSLLDLLTKGTS